MIVTLTQVKSVLARSLILSLLAALWLAQPATAQTGAGNAEARTLFERGNDLFQQALGSRGERRQQLMRQALTQYVNSLQIARSRNALYNAAVVSAELNRNADAFNYFAEYLRIDGLTADEIADAKKRQDAVRITVGLASITSEPPGARIHIDRGDLAPVGQTPAEVALKPGEHRVIVRRKGYKTAVKRGVFKPGERQVLSFELEALPVPVTVIVKDGTSAFIDGAPVTPGQPTSVMPGEHVVKLTRGSESTEQTITVSPGDPPRTVRVELPDAVTKPPGKSLRNGAIAAGATMLAAAGVGVGLAFRARNLRDDFDRAAAIAQMTGDPADRARAESIADDVDRANITADSMFALAGAAGVTGLVLYLVHRKRVRRHDEDRAAMPRLRFGASQEGAMLQAQWKVGASK